MKILSVVLGVGVLSACSTRPASISAGPSVESQVWWRNGVCYEVFVRSFQDSDGDGIGDLRGLTSRLDYINDGNPASTTSLGANCIWLMPIATAMSYHGYDVVDYYHVDRRYGTDEDFRSLVAGAHQRGIHVIVDFVPNHTGSGNPWFQAALRDPGSAYRDWYRWSNTLPSQKGPWGQVAWHKSPARDEYYYGVFWHEMPDLNYENRSVRAEMQKVLTYWLEEMHADGFRFDAVPYLVEEGDQLQHTRGTHDVLRQLGNAVRAASARSFTVGEMSDESPDILATYYPDQLDAYFAFGVAFATMRSARSGDAGAFTEAIHAANATFPEGRWAPFLANHDHERVMTQLGDPGKARVAASAMLLLPGMPFVYYGEELGMVGAKPDETIRTPMQWSGQAGGGFTAGKPWESFQPDWQTKNVAVQDRDAGSLLSHYRRLIHFRNAHSALSRGTLSVAPTTKASSAAYVRSSGHETILIVVNFGGTPLDALDVSLASPVDGSRQLELLYADPGRCGSAAIGDDGKTVSLRVMQARGICAFRVPRD